MDILPIFKDLISLLETGGPWALVVIIGWVAYKKDKESSGAYQAMHELSLAQTAALVRLETTVRSLRDVLILRPGGGKPE